MCLIYFTTIANSHSSNKTLHKSYFKEFIFTSIIIFQSISCTYSQCSKTDSINGWYSNYEMRELFKKGAYKEASNIFAENYRLERPMNRTGYLYGGKASYKLKNDSLVLRIFTESNKNIIGDFCRLDWGDGVENSDEFKLFCSNNEMILDKSWRKNAKDKINSDLFATCLVEDQGMRLDTGIKSNLIKYGYAHIFSNLSTDSSAKELHENHVRLLKDYISNYGFPNKTVIGKYGMDGVKATILHSSLEDLKYFTAYLKKNTPLHAMVLDKILVQQKKPQLFGSQGIYCENLKRNVLYPVKDLEQLDLFRMRHNMSPIKYYIKSVGVIDASETCEE